MEKISYPRHPDEILFEKLKYFIQPIKDLAIILDLDLYRKGITQMYVFEHKSKEFMQFINCELASNERNFMLWVYLQERYVEIDTKNIRLSYNLEKNELNDYVNLNTRGHFIQLSMKQQMECLVYELNHPKPEKPDC
jgi:hypothetical protein